LHVTASYTSLSRTQLSPDGARISYSFSWICDTLRQIWEMRDREHGREGRFERWEMRGREHGAKGRFERWGGWESENGEISLGLENMLFILLFSRDSLVEPGRFGSVQLVSDFENRNRTESEIFCDFLIGLIGFFSRFGFFGYFFSGFLGLIGFFGFFAHP